MNTTLSVEGNINFVNNQKYISNIFIYIDVCVCVCHPTKAAYDLDTSTSFCIPLPDPCSHGWLCVFLQERNHILIVLFGSRSRGMARYSQ